MNMMHSSHQMNKQRNRNTVSAKESPIISPQFQITATPVVSEKSVKQHGSASGRDALRHGDLISAANQIRRSQQSEGTLAYLSGTDAYLHGDHVVFAESPAAPGIPIVYRSPEERSSNPDRLNLDRRRLTICPILEGEDQLRLLNYQHNLISRIQHLSNLKRLIFLDLYDNQIQEISGLAALKSLRVLMLGKNKIQKIENLDNLTKLDVLDLHGNQISQVENLTHLGELRVLNLAGNLISHVDRLMGMDSLAELNLRRNRIHSVSEVDCLPNLQRLFLSFNDISNFEDISCLGGSNSLSELSLDGNPLAAESGYKQNVLRHMQQLRQLDMKRISEDERRIAAVMARKEEERKRETNKIAVMKEKRRLAINNARRQWEVMQGSMMSRTNKLVKNVMPEIYANHVGTYPNGELLGAESGAGEEQSLEGGDDRTSSRSSDGHSRPTSAKSQQSLQEWPPPAGVKPGSRGLSHSSLTGSRGTTPDREKPVAPGRSQAGTPSDHLAELEGDTLSLYGSGALDSLDKNWGVQAAGAVTTICFKFIDFDDIVKHLHKIRARFPSVQTLVFNSTNIHSLQQLNGLAGLRRLDNLTVEGDGNPVTQFSLWRTYGLFRLAHFAMKKINDVEVCAADVVNAEKFFGALSHMTTTELPKSRLVSLLGENRKKQLLSLEEKSKSKTQEAKITERANIESVGRAGLVYNPPDTQNSNKTQDFQNRQEFCRKFVQNTMKEATQVDQKRLLLHKMWPQILTDMVHAAVMDLWDTKAYMKRCIEDLEKT